MLKNIRSLSSLYPVIAYSKDDSLFFIADRKKSSLGFGFVLEPLGGGDASIADRLEVLLNQDFPRNTVIQFSLVASQAIDELLYENEAVALANDKDSLLRNIILNKNKYFKEASVNALPHLPNVVRNYEVIISITLPCASLKVAEHEIEHAKSLSQMSYEVLKTAGFLVKNLNNEAFIKKLSPFFNSSPLAPWRNDAVKIDDDKPIADQIFDYDSSMKVYDNHLTLGDYYVNTYSFKRLPDHVFFGQAMRYSADILTGARGIHVPFMLTATVFYPDSANLKTKIATKRQWVINQAYGPLVKFLPKLGVRKHGFDLLYEQIENGQRPLKLNLTLITFAQNEEQAQKVSSAVRTYYKENSFEIMADRYFVLPIFLNSLPLGCDFTAINTLMRFKTLTPKHIIPLLPIFADGKGTSSSVLNLVSRSGQLMGTSIYDSPTNYNLCIAAQSGSGKSFLVNEIIVSFLARGATCYVIDIGRSYQKLCNFLGGTFLSFGMNSDISLNPFYCIGDYNEENDMLAGLIGSMIAPTQKLSDFQVAELKRILSDLYSRHQKDTTLDMLADTLKSSNDVRIKDMGTQLYAFTSKGEYGKFFSGKNSLAFNDNFTVLELEELKGRRQLQQVVLLQLIYQIQQKMYLANKHQKNNTPKIIIIDEAWDLLRDGDVARFIETGYRRFRKYGGAAVIVTQSINDLYSSDVGCAIAENSANMYLLGQKAETIASLKRHNRLPLSDGEYELLKSVHTVSGVYSEIFLITPNGHSIGRLVVDRFRSLLYTTKPNEIARIDGLLAKNLSLTEAINEIIKEEMACEGAGNGC